MVSRTIKWQHAKKHLSALTPYDKNPRIVDEIGKKILQESMDEIGYAQFININLDGTILSGHARYRQLKEENPDQIVDVLQPSYQLPPELEEAVVIRLNKNVAGKWDFDILANQWDVEKLLDLGFSPEEIPTPDIPGDDGLTDDDAIPDEEEIEPTCKLGDLWKLGDHRLMCGDSTKVENVHRLMDGDKADMVFTDPPYGMNAVSKSGVLSKNYHKDILGDSNTNAAKNSFTLFIKLFKDAEQLWWGANYYSSCLPDSECWLVWNKNNGQSDQTDCELAWCNFRSVVRMFTQSSEKKDRVHPTQKPVALFEWVVEKFRLAPCIVVDPFLGSGSTLIACEKTNRKCYGMELDPHYCDVIIKRWEDYTGKKAEKIG